MNKLLLIVLLMACMIGVVSAAPFIPSGNIDGKNFYTIYNFTNISAQHFYYTNGTELVNGGGSGSTVSNATILQVCSVYNETSSITSLNSSKLDITDQRYNETTKINSVNTSTNIKSLGFNLTTELKTYFDTLYYAIGNPSNFITSSVGILTNFYNKTETDIRYLQITSQIYNETNGVNSVNTTVQALLTSNTSTNTKLNNVNTTQNIMNLGFYNTTYIDSKLNVTIYPANTITTLTGTNTAGTITSIQTMNDGNWYNVSEVSGVPGFNVQINFTGVTNFNQIYTNMYYQGNPAHEVDIQLYNWVAGTWDTFGVLPTDGMMSIHTYGISGDGSYINGTNVSMRIYHVTTGNSNHRLYIDYAVLQYGNAFTDLSQYLLISDQRYNDTGRIDSLNSTKAGTGTATCAAGTVAQNVTTSTSGITTQCIAASGTSISANSFQCSGSDQMYNISITSGGVLSGVCSAQGSGGGMTSWLLSNGTATATITDGNQVNFTSGTGIIISQNGKALQFNSTVVDTNDTNAVNTLINSNTSTNGRIDSLNVTKLNITDQRFNESGRVDLINTTATNAISYVVIANNTANIANTTANNVLSYVVIANNTANIANTTANALVSSNTTTNSRIDSLNTTKATLGTDVNIILNWTYLQNYPAACPAGSALTTLGDAITCTAFGNVTTGSCAAGTFVQNTTTSGVQCAAAGGTGTVTQIIFTAPGLTGGTITGSGTVALNTTYLDATYAHAADLTIANNTANIANATANALVTSNTTLDGRITSVNNTALKNGSSAYFTIVNFTSDLFAHDYGFYFNTTSNKLFVSTGGDFDTSANILVYGDYDSYRNQSTNTEVSDTYAGLSISSSRGTGKTPLGSAVGDFLGGVRWYLYNGTAFRESAFIESTITNNQTSSRLDIGTNFTTRLSINDTTIDVKVNQTTYPNACQQITNTTGWFIVC